MCVYLYAHTLSEGFLFRITLYILTHIGFCLINQRHSLKSNAVYLGQQNPTTWVHVPRETVCVLSRTFGANEVFEGQTEEEGDVEMAQLIKHLPYTMRT